MNDHVPFHLILSAHLLQCRQPFMFYDSPLPFCQMSKDVVPLFVNLETRLRNPAVNDPVLSF